MPEDLSRDVDNMSKQTNILTGTVTKVVRGPTNEVVTVRLDPTDQPIEFTVSWTPVPETPTKTDAPRFEAATTPAPAGSSGSGGTKEGSKVQIVVPVPNGFVVSSN